MASNALVDIFRVKDLRQRILYTLGMLVVFRLGTILPIPGINLAALKVYFAAQQSGITDYIDFFSGGAFKNFSVFMLGVMPYISMTIITQLLVIVLPSLKKMTQEEGGQKKMQRINRIGTVFVCIIQSYAVTVWADQIPNAVSLSKLSYTLIAMLTVTTGSMMLL
jgi:preprotein translocase subunit SecY